ncbi:MAG: type III-B CRISPR-associated protein Cas10/Cmr2 [Desulfobacterales bacterium]|nr:MAG: type III-B CRISPR-associated protein Cas10/Cmr2 [Desulfobacterales bacterium]
MSDKQTFLLAISVGPVQEFIASARKLRDLWYGSWILSELSKAVARKLTEAQCKLIFPGVSDEKLLAPNSELNAANKIIVTVKAREEEISALTESGQRAFHQHWKEIAENAFARVPEKDQAKIDRELFKKQLDDFGEYFAAWTPLTENYPKSLEHCERLLAARKRLREFSAPSWNGSGLSKSSLDGIRETVLKKDTKIRSYQIKKGEHLDAMGLIKRFGPIRETTSPHFDHFAQLAVVPLLDNIEKQIATNSSVEELLTSFPVLKELYPQRDIARNGIQNKRNTLLADFPVELLLPLTLEEEIASNKGKDNSTLWLEIQRNVSRLHHSMGTPTPYVCLLVGDGDNIGQTLSQIKKMTDHRQFSTELDRFAKEVRLLFKKYSGQVIYSGGDDVMGYLPLHKMLSCATAVNDLFTDIMKTACMGTGIEQYPTFSLGVAIVHVKEPMDQVLTLARKAEKIAKQQGRNRLAIIQSKRSGDTIEICGLWNKDNALLSLDKRMKEWVVRYKRGTLSSRFAYQLREIAKVTGDKMTWKKEDSRNVNPVPDSPAALEAIRLMCHKDFGDKFCSREAAEKLLAGYSSLGNLAKELVIAHQLASADLTPITKGEE